MNKLACVIGLLGLTGLLLTCGGCGGDLATVSGTVTMDGKALPEATVTFRPAEGAVGYGTSDAEGHYTIRTGASDGLAPGDYKVTVQAYGELPESAPEDSEVPPPVITPGKYADANLSGITFKIPAGGKNDCNIEMVSK
ncbi:MAG: carboxypeptidase regulatory-like domain-containing protein [Planctomycetes bacterium]|nr:carboxypeptidase regulatory-like domain-containing protein [Planctomycetota bacterium]